MAALLGLALLPIGIIAMVQTYRVIDEADRNAEAALVAATLTAATVERESILRVRGAAQIAARTFPGLLDDPEECSARAASFVNEVANVTFAGVVSMEGIAICGSDGIGTDLSGSTIYQEFIDDPRPHVNAVTGGISRRSVVVVSEPYRVDGEIAGYVALSIPQNTLEVNRREGELDPLFATSFTADGKILWTAESEDNLSDELPPESRMIGLGSEEPISFRDTSQGGANRFYTIAPLLPGELYALAVWPPSAVRTAGLTAASAILFPLLMWMVSIGVAYFAVHRLVVRHIRYLRLRIRAFTANRRIMPPRYGSDTPSDLREVIEAFHQMTERIVRDEADLENSIHEKDVLLKEVHHRVKNNLQLIASMMNMQLRKATEAETRFILRRLQDRVLGLATIHRNLYQASVLSRVDSAHLIRELVDQTVKNSDAADQGVSISIGVDDVALYPDQAVPLSLLVTETVTNALKYVGRPPNGTPWIELTLRELAENSVELRVANSTGPYVNDEAQVSTGLGQQLMAAFAMQLDADTSIEDEDDAYIVTVAFNPSEFAQES
ncbi:sensor histidine kinase [Palleronia sp. THAF1]|uniref:sensor histidine kinase n=1 Tax=Palleronia sp. THAF1 TaxID=2587842 RepID=UPI000F542B5D|nr:sensor histidine kinase [Palleronia sp. THAF1]